MKRKIAVITPYYQESTEVLLQCYQSVQSQEMAADHFFIADGFPKKELCRWNVKHIPLPQSHSDNGNTPRGIGSFLAASEGYDFIAYLDADNWFHPNHLSSLLDLWERTKADICSSFWTYHCLDGTPLNIRELDEVSLKHIDTSCLLLHSSAFASLDIWLKMPKQLSPVCDRVFLAGLRNMKYRFASTKLKTVAFRSQYKSHYLGAKLDPPINSKENVSKEPAEWLRTIEGTRETIRKLGFFPAWAICSFKNHLNHSLSKSWVHHQPRSACSLWLMSSAESV